MVVVVVVRSALCADEFCFALEVAHRRIQINVTAFNFFRSFYLSPSLPSGFLIFTGPSSLWLPSILETDAP